MFSALRVVRVGCVTCGYTKPCITFGQLVYQYVNYGYGKLWSMDSISQPHYCILTLIILILIQFCVYHTFCCSWFLQLQYKSISPSHCVLLLQDKQVVAAPTPPTRSSVRVKKVQLKKENHTGISSPSSSNTPSTPEDSSNR